MKNRLAIFCFLFCALFTLSAFAVDLPTRKDKGYASPETVEGATTVDASWALAASTVVAPSTVSGEA
jgi:hypothetical protein